MGRHARLGLLHLVRIVTCQLQLQLRNLRRQEFGVRSEATDAGLDQANTAMETTGSIDTNELTRCASSFELVVDGGRPMEHMAVANAENPGARFVELGIVFVKEEPFAPLSIIVLPLLGSDGHAEHSGQETSNVVGGVGVEGDTQKGWTCERLHCALVPVYHGSLDSKLLEKTDDIGESIVRILGGGGVGNGSQSK